MPSIPSDEVEVLTDYFNGIMIDSIGNSVGNKNAAKVLNRHKPITAMQLFVLVLMGEGQYQELIKGVSEEEWLKVPFGKEITSIHDAYRAEHYELGVELTKALTDKLTQQWSELKQKAPEGQKQERRPSPLADGQNARSDNDAQR